MLMTSHFELAFCRFEIQSAYLSIELEMVKVVYWLTIAATVLFFGILKSSSNGSNKVSNLQQESAPPTKQPLEAKQEVQDRVSSQDEVQSSEKSDSTVRLGIQTTKPAEEPFVELPNGRFMVPYAATIPGTEIKFTMLAKQYTKWLSLLSEDFYRLPTETEWVLDQYNEDGYGYEEGDSVTAEDAYNKPTKLYPRVARGGHYLASPEECRSASRLGSENDWRATDPQIPRSPFMADGRACFGSWNSVASAPRCSGQQKRKGELLGAGRLGDYGDVLGSAECETAWLLRRG